MSTIEEIDLSKAFNEKPAPLDFILPGMLAGTVGALVSPGGMGKSFFALQLATQITGGPDLMGLGPLKHGKVLYIAAEDPREALYHRMYALGSLLSDEQKNAVKKNLVVTPKMGKPINILEPEIFKELVSEGAGKRLIIIDTLRRFHNGDENSSGDMAQVIGKMESICLETGSSLIFIHHSSKSSSSYGTQAQSSRGSSVLIDNIRWQAQLIGLSKKELEDAGCDEYESNMIKFKITKQNYGSFSPDLWLQRMHGGFLKKFDAKGKSSHGGKRNSVSRSEIAELLNELY
jgi:RecA-family ATPase